MTEKEIAEQMEHTAWLNHLAKETADRERFGGPITSGMLMTALNECAHDDVIAHRLFDVERLAKIVNGWLTPVQQ